MCHSVPVISWAPQPNTCSNPPPAVEPPRGRPFCVSSHLPSLWGGTGHAEVRGALLLGVTGVRSPQLTRPTALLSGWDSLAEGMRVFLGPDVLIWSHRPIWPERRDYYFMRERQEGLRFPDPLPRRLIEKGHSKEIQITMEAWVDLLLQSDNVCLIFFLCPVRENRFL